MSAARRLGLFGGAFDPPHAAHAALAAVAIGQLGLDELRILPTGQAWHKARGLTPASHRVAMARLAFAGLPQAVLDEREIRREGPSYTVDTLREIAAETPGAALFLVIGADQALAFDRWRAPDEIARLRSEMAVEIRHPGWQERVRTPEFVGWLQRQNREVQLLAASESPQDAVRLLDLHTEALGTASTQRTQRLNSAAALPTGRGGGNTRTKPVEEMSPQEYWRYLDELDRQKGK